MSFYGANNTPVLDFWWCLLWVSKPEWATLFTIGRGIRDVSSLIFTSVIMNKFEQVRGGPVQWGPSLKMSRAGTQCREVARGRGSKQGDPLPPNRQTDRHDWKHHLQTTLFAGGNNQPIRSHVNSWSAGLNSTSGDKFGTLLS